jgi:hypothetical protein
MQRAIGHLGHLVPADLEDLDRTLVIRLGLRRK